MKKKLEAELISIAHKILQLKDDSSVAQLQEQARQLYEKLSILNFAESHFTDVQPTIGGVRDALATVVSDIQEPAKSKSVIQLDQDMDFEEKVIEARAEPIPNTIDIPIEKIEDKKPEIVIEKINEKVSEDLFVPAPKFTEENISLSEEESTPISQGLPILDINKEEKPKSLNDQLKKGITIGLNDRLAFIKHLFDGSSEDYNRVLSQLNTLNSKSGARQFIINMVKPDYKNWEGKDEYEERFIEIVTNKYEF